MPVLLSHSHTICILNEEITTPTNCHAVGCHPKQPIGNGSQTACGLQGGCGPKAVPRCGASAFAQATAPPRTGALHCCIVMLSPELFCHICGHTRCVAGPGLDDSGLIQATVADKCILAGHFVLHESVVIQQPSRCDSGLVQTVVHYCVLVKLRGFHRAKQLAGLYNGVLLQLKCTRNVVRWVCWGTVKGCHCRGHCRGHWQSHCARHCTCPSPCPRRSIAHVHHFGVLRCLARLVIRLQPLQNGLCHLHDWLAANPTLEAIDMPLGPESTDHVRRVVNGFQASTRTKMPRGGCGSACEMNGLSSVDGEFVPRDSTTTNIALEAIHMPQFSKGICAFV
mmetsp:Transcript_3615/g.6980  ORF Transcript_3615/g.6980 Transcript_3615/m.6980 type:complete len:338 (-) Transcript_3615:421-1434(-)